MRLGCAREFAKVHGEIERVKNGHDTQAIALEKLTGAVEASALEVRRNHNENMRMTAGFQANLVEMFSKQSERTALVEQKSDTLHDRLDGQHKMLWAIVLLVLTAAAGVIVKAWIG